MELKWNGPFTDDPKFADDVHLVCVIDKSGSMSGKEKDVISGFNKFIEEQKALPGNAYITLIQFSDKVDVLLNRVALQHVAGLNEKTYKVGGSTALLDAIGTSINRVYDKKVQVLIITDGEENSSKMYNKSTIVNLIKQKTEEGWSFIYLGAGVNSFHEATSMGIHTNNFVNYTGTSTGTRAAYATLSTGAAQFRSKGHATMDSNFLAETYSKAEADAAKTV